ncbi:hypothetical protein ABH926_004289 [Catenulispora sp. GP43]
MTATQDFLATSLHHGDLQLDEIPVPDPAAPSTALFSVPSPAQEPTDD